MGPHIKITAFSAQFLSIFWVHKKFQGVHPRVLYAFAPKGGGGIMF